MSKLELFEDHILDECDGEVDELAGIFGENTHFIRSLRYSMKIKGRGNK